eukprot:m.101427 g.101427  ORF g.101427 m.101427 type:complete len:811 (-) comp13744_c0_seq2:3462-5894(-)
MPSFQGAHDGITKYESGLGSVPKHLGKLEKRCFTACLRGDENYAAELIKQGVDFTSMQDTRGNSMVHYAVLQNQALLLDTLLAVGSSVTIKNNDRVTALHVACLQHDYVAAHKLLRAGAHSNQPDKNGRTALHTAVDEGSVDVLAVLLRNTSAALDLRDEEGLTPLHLAVQHGHEDQVKMLLNKGADPLIVTGTGDTCAHLAIKNANLACLRIVAASNSSILSTHDAEGASVLHMAVREGQMLVVDTLLECNADVNLPDANGRTALHWSAITNNPACLDILLAHGADPLNQDVFGGTALHYIMQLGSTKCLKTLLNKSSSEILTVCDTAGRQPLLWGVIHNQYTTCKKLLSVADVVNQKDSEDFSALHYAAHAGQSRLCELLISYGAELDCCDQHGQTALFRAVIEGHSACANVLLEAGTREDLVDSTGRTCLHWAVHHGQSHLVQALLKHGCPVDIKDHEGLEALHECAKKGTLDLLEVLLEGKANVTSVDNLGYTSLHYAAIRGREDICRRLLDGGASADVLDNSDPPQTPFDLARLAAHSACADLLRNAMSSKMSESDVDSAELSADSNKQDIESQSELDEDQSSIHATQEIDVPDVANANYNEIVEKNSAISHNNEPIKLPKIATLNTEHSREPRLPSYSKPIRLPAANIRNQHKKTSEKPTTEQILENNWNSRFSVTEPAKPVNEKKRFTASRGPSAQTVQYDGLTSELLMDRGEPPGRHASTSALLKYREEQIRKLKAKNRELVEAVDPKHFVVNVASQVKELRKSLVPTEKEVFKGKVKKALYEIKRLRSETESMCSHINAAV